MEEFILLAVLVMLLLVTAFVDVRDLHPLTGLCVR